MFHFESIETHFNFFKNVPEHEAQNACKRSEQEYADCDTNGSDLLVEFLGSWGPKRINSVFLSFNFNQFPSINLLNSKQHDSKFLTSSKISGSIKNDKTDRQKDIQTYRQTHRHSTIQTYEHTDWHRDHTIHFLYFCGLPYKT